MEKAKRNETYFVTLTIKNGKQINNTSASIIRVKHDLEIVIYNQCKLIKLNQVANLLRLNSKIAVPETSVEEKLEEFIKPKTRRRKKSNRQQIFISVQQRKSR